VDDSVVMDSREYTLDIVEDWDEEGDVAEEGDYGEELVGEEEEEDDDLFDEDDDI